MSILKTFHHDERGAPELSTILLVAFIVVPLLGLLIAFRDKISEKSVELWIDVFEQGSQSLDKP